jgi:hypothetical protein
MKPIRNNLIIELHVPDLDKVKDFYSKLGFTITMNNEVNDKELGYLTMTGGDDMGNTMLNFYGGDDRVYDQSYFKQFPRDTKRAYASEVTIVVKDIEAMFNLAMENLKEYIVRPLESKEDHNHKWRDFRMEDPFGFYLRFTELLDWGQK